LVGKDDKSGFCSWYPQSSKDSVFCLESLNHFRGDNHHCHQQQHHHHFISKKTKHISTFIIIIIISSSSSIISTIIIAIFIGKSKTGSRG
jgi:hypothetical protein